MTTTVSVLSATLLMLLLATFAGLLMVAIVFNFRAGLKYRRALAEQLDNYRLAKMLTALGIDIDEYLSTERVVDINTQMTRCGACENVGECDEKLAGGRISAGNIGFCNNEQSLQKLARSPDQTGTAGD
ncbi:MAG: DUF6455 family protein [Gammaproteobacteria bacterium]